MMGEIESAIHPLGFVWLALVALGFRSIRRSGNRLQGLVLIALAGILWVFAATPLPWHLLARMERPFDRFPPPSATPFDAIVMLGGTHDHSARHAIPVNAGDPIDRFITAAEWYRSGAGRNLVLGGSRYRDSHGATHPSADLLVEWAKRWHIGGTNIHSLGICADTRDEAARTGELAKIHKWQRVMIVSTACHLPRARAVFQKLGVSVEYVGCDFFGLDGLEQGGQWAVIPRIRGLEMTRYWLHEILGMAWYRVRGWV